MISNRTLAASPLAGLHTHSPCTSECTGRWQIKIPWPSSAPREGHGSRTEGRAHSHHISCDMFCHSSKRWLKPPEEIAMLHITRYYSLSLSITPSSLKKNPKKGQKSRAHQTLISSLVRSWPKFMRLIFTSIFGLNCCTTSKFKSIFSGVQ